MRNEKSPASRDEIEKAVIGVLGERPDAWLTTTDVHVRLEHTWGANRLQVAAVLDELSRTSRVCHRRDKASDLWSAAAGETLPPAAIAPVPATMPTGPSPTVPAPADEAPRAQHGQTTKAKVAELLRQHPALTIKQVAEQLNMSEGAIAYHFKSLHTHKLVAGFQQSRSSPLKDPPAQQLAEQPLDAELLRLAARFAPLNHLPEKIAVLDTLASSIGGKVGTLLVEIRDDLVRAAA